MVLKASSASESPGGLAKSASWARAPFLNQQVWQKDLEICISRKIQCDADAAGVRTTLRTTGVVYRTWVSSQSAWIQILAPSLRARTGGNHFVSELILIAHLYLLHRVAVRIT